MKVIYKTFYLAIAIFAITSCGTEESDTNTSEKDNNGTTIKDSVTNENNADNVNEIIDDNTIVSKYNYDADWEIIKKALLNNDLKTLTDYSLQNNVDVEELLVIAKDQFIVDALKETSYSDLEPVDMEDGVYLVFYADAKYEAEDGEVYESSISIYFEQGDQNLKLAYYLIAG